MNTTRFIADTVPSTRSSSQSRLLLQAHQISKRLGKRESAPFFAKNQLAVDSETRKGFETTGETTRARTATLEAEKAHLVRERDGLAHQYEQMRDEFVNTRDTLETETNRASRLEIELQKKQARVSELLPDIDDLGAANFQLGARLEEKSQNVRRSAQSAAA